ncbi:hypothetical protein GC56T3_3418 [Geobacillus sp. C56-T3]|nr:hypothetical protein GC56T3_3418 [Geobacillus sp. C56-T3]
MSKIVVRDILRQISNESCGLWFVVLVRGGKTKLTNKRQGRYLKGKPLF